MYWSEFPSPLYNDLNQTDKKHKIVISHVPPVTFFKESAKRCHDMSCSEPNRSQLISILRKHRVDLVISGHEEAFDHKTENGIDFVISGKPSGAEPRYKNIINKKIFSFFTVTNSGITLKAIDVEGNLIREIKIKG